MKVICWNVQSAKKHQIREKIKILNCNFCPNIFFFLETMHIKYTLIKPLLNWASIILIVSSLKIIRGDLGFME